MRMIRLAHYGYLLRPAKLLCLALLTTPGAAFAQQGLSITENVAPDFGTLLGGASSRQFILNTDASISGTDSGDYLFGAAAGDLTVDRSGAPKNINIVAENITTSGGLTVAQVLCAYDGASQTACDSPGIDVQTGPNKTLLLGIDISTSQVHSGGDSASVTLDISVTFL